MSASTVSITANTAAATRRRPVVADKSKASNIELLTADPQQRNGSVAENDKVVGASRDLSHHSIRERSAREPVQLKRTGGGAAASTVSPRRGKKTVSKPEKPRWVTMLSVFTKNFVLLVVLIGLAQTVRKLVEKSGEERRSSFGAGLDSLEFDERFAEVESLVKTTAKMMQTQVEVVDSKIQSEVGGLRREIKRIDEKGQVLESGMKELTKRGEGLERDVKKLSAKDWVSKQELERLYEDLKKGKWSAGSGNDATLDEIRVYAREVVEREIAKHAADGLGMVDYALAAGGATVVKHSEPYNAGVKRVNWFSKSSLGRVHHSANKMLTPSFGEPGQCFPLKGSAGSVEIRLRVAIIPEAITLEHVAKSVAYDRSSAPKDCRVSGWLQGEAAESGVDSEKMYFLTEFTYDLEKTNAQTYYVQDSPESGIIDTVRLDFTSNHGSPTHTCIYRLRVHGREPDSVSMTAMQP